MTRPCSPRSTRRSATASAALGRTPEETLDAVVAELSEAAKGAAAGTLAPDRHAELAREVAVAFGLQGDEAIPFLELVGATEARRRREVRDAETAARNKRREEVQRLKTWEKSLVEFRDVSGLLGCVEKEALRWVAAGLIPVARRIPQKGGREKWEFDPAELANLRALVPQWREADKGALDAKKRSGLAAPAFKLGRGASAAIARVAALDRYAGHFATARALNRRITLITGPTNSGKSHTALDRLAKAENGVALAPLRLLAHEFRDALASRGVPASLSTGEERIRVPGSRHLAATVEMCPFHLPVDVALIDEAQMLGDRDRGAAWTAAIMGAPARDVFVLGAPEAATQVRRIAALCGDPMEEISLKRKGPLTASKTPVSLGDLQVGDAIVAFSRRDVLDMRAELVRRGRRVAVVYGALSPEVRRAEAARFRDGDADILVATDAIGMGLNLPIRRVIFSTLRKFDGEQRRELNTQEVKQIGGRAGRYGRFEEGVVAVLAGGGSPEFIRTMLEADPVPPEDPRPLVQPDSRHHRQRGAGDRLGQPVRRAGADQARGAAAGRPELPPGRPHPGHGGGQRHRRRRRHDPAGALDLRHVPGGRTRQRHRAPRPLGDRARRRPPGRSRPPPAGSPRRNAPAGTSWNAPRRPTSGWSPGAGWRCASRMPMSPATRPMAKPSGWTAGSRTCCASSAARSWSPDAADFVMAGLARPSSFPFRGAARRPGPSTPLMPFPPFPPRSSPR